MKIVNIAKTENIQNKTTPVEFRSLMLLLLVTGLAACGGGSDTNPKNPLSSVNLNTKINSFTVIGTSSTVAGTVPINPGVSGGFFSVGWDISSTDPYHIDLYVSHDNALSKTSDTKFFSQNCGSTSSIYNCSQTGNFSCQFTSANSISCGTVSATNPAKDLTSFFSALPETDYLILEACDGLFLDCQQSAVKVEFQ